MTTPPERPTPLPLPLPDHDWPLATALATVDRWCDQLGVLARVPKVRAVMAEARALIGALSDQAITNRQLAKQHAVEMLGYIVEVDALRHDLAALRAAEPAVDDEAPRLRWVMRPGTFTSFELVDDSGVRWGWCVNAAANGRWTPHVGSWGQADRVDPTAAPPVPDDIGPTVENHESAMAWVVGRIVDHHWESANPPPSDHNPPPADTGPVTPMRRFVVSAVDDGNLWWAAVTFQPTPTWDQLAWLVDMLAARMDRDCPAPRSTWHWECEPEDPARTWSGIISGATAAPE